MGGKVAAEAWKVVSAPTTFWIDHNGRVLSTEVGFSPLMFPAMENKAERLIARQKAAAKAK